MKTKVNVTYTVSYVVECILDIPNDLWDKLDDELSLEGVDVQVIYELNNEVLEGLEGGDYVDDSYEINNIHKIL